MDEQNAGEQLRPAIGRPTSLLIGDTSRREFHEPVERIRADSLLTRACCLDQAERLLAGEESSSAERLAPDLMIVVQSRPGQFAALALDRLKRLAPVARFLFLLGSWCEGETRTGAPWPAATRIYWYDWSARWQVELSRLLAGRCPVWGLPETAPADQRILWSVDDPIPARRGTVVIRARGQETVDALADACRRWGYSTEPLAMDRPVTEPLGAASSPRRIAAVWEGTQCQADEARELALFQRAVHRLPIVALLDFPRFDGRNRALQAGATHVVSKPLVLDDFFWAIDQAALLGGPICKHASHQRQQAA